MVRLSMATGVILTDPVTWWVKMKNDETFELRLEYKGETILYHELFVRGGRIQLN